MRTVMFAFAAVAPRLASHAASTGPRSMGQRVDLLSTLAILIIGLVLVAGAIRAALKQ